MKQMLAAAALAATIAVSLSACNSSGTTTSANKKSSTAGAINTGAAPVSAARPKADSIAATLRLPASFDSFTVAKDSDSLALLARAKATSKPAANVNASVLQQQLYIDAAGHRLFVSGASAHDSADLRAELHGEPHETTLSNSLIGFNVVGATAVPTAPYAGLMRCGLSVQGNNRNTPVCAWVDDDTYVVVLDVSIALVGGEALTVHQLAVATSALRAKAESR